MNPDAPTTRISKLRLAIFLGVCAYAVCLSCCVPTMAHGTGVRHDAPYGCRVRVK